MRTDANPRRECTCFFDIMWCVSAAQYYRISELLQDEQRRYGLMPGKLSEVTQKLSAAAEEYNRIDQEHQAQASVCIAGFFWVAFHCIQLASHHHILLHMFLTIMGQQSLSSFGKAIQFSYSQAES